MNTIQHLVTTDATGTVDVTAWVNGMQWGTRTPGGFATAQISLRPPTWLAYQLARGWPGGTYRGVFWGTTVWEGNLSGMQRGGAQMTLYAAGAGMQALRDVEAWTVYADSDYGFWYPEDSEQFDADNNNRVYVQTRDGVTYTTGDECGMWYPQTGVVLTNRILSVTAQFDVTITSGSWSAELRRGTGVVLWSTTITVSTTATVTMVAPGATQLWWGLRCTSGGAGSATARLTLLTVGCLASLASEEVLNNVLTAAGVTAYDVQVTGFLMEHAVYQGNQRLWDVAQDVALYGDGTTPWVLVMYENGAVLRAWESTPDWLLTGDYLSDSGWQQDREDVWNAVQALLPDGWSTGWLTDADSIAKYGRREKTISLPQMSRAQATALATVFLAERAEAVSSIRLDAGLRVQRADRSEWPACFIRAGDVVRLRDVVTPFEDVDVRVGETTFDGRVLRIVPEGAANRLETILGALEVGRAARIIASVAVGGG